jgi:predicted ester cyclase
MSVEDNKAIEQRIIEEVFNKQNTALMDELYTPDYIYHGGVGVGDLQLEGVKQMGAAMSIGFPDSHINIDNMIAEGDKVVCHYTFTGTHQGEFMGIPPTGKQIGKAERSLGGK